MSEMFVEMLIKMMISFYLLFSVVILTFSIFKVPIKNNDKQIAVLSLILGATNFYVKFILNSPLHFIILLSLFLILLVVFRQYPVFYAAIVSVGGLLAASVFDILISVYAIWLNISSVDLGQHYVMLNLASATICLLFAWIIVKLKLGFSFVKSRFSGKYSLKIYNFIWAAILLIAVFFVQFVVVKTPILSLHGIFLVGIIIFFLVNIIYAWKQNKKSLADRQLDSGS
jgi:hypothetical protein